MLLEVLLVLAPPIARCFKFIRGPTRPLQTPVVPQDQWVGGWKQDAIQWYWVGTSKPRHEVANLVMELRRLDAHVFQDLMLDGWDVEPRPRLRMTEVLCILTSKQRQKKQSSSRLARATSRFDPPADDTGAFCLSFESSSSPFVSVFVEACHILKDQTSKLLWVSTAVIQYPFECRPCFASSLRDNVRKGRPFGV